jgi:hypothetical protein
VISTGVDIVGKSYFLLGPPFKLAQAATPSCIAGPAATAVELASGDGLRLNCGHQPSALKALIMAAEATVRRDGYRRNP